MRSGTCPKCSATTVYGARDRFNWGGGARVETGGLTPVSVVDTYVCTTCGYFENYLADPDTLQRLAHAWGKVERQ